MRLHEGVGLAIEREAVDAVAHRDHEHGRRSVDGEPRRHLPAAGLQKRLLLGLAVLAIGGLRAAQHREDGADRNVDVDIGGAVQRVDEQQILAALVRLGDRHRTLDLLGGERREVAAPDVGLHEDFVGEHVELLLRLALHVVGAGAAQPVGERAFVDAGADRLAGARDGLEQQPQVGVDHVLLLASDEELRKRYSFHAGAILCVVWQTTRR